MNFQASFTMADLIDKDSSVSIEVIEKCIEWLNKKMQSLVDSIPTEIKSLLTPDMNPDLLDFFSKNWIIQAYSFLDRFRMICYFAISIRKGEVVDNQESIKGHINFILALWLTRRHNYPVHFPFTNREKSLQSASYKN